jgi:hypothetical protein
MKMDSEAIKANERRFFDYVNNKDVDAMEKWIDEHVAEDFVNHSPMFDVSTDRHGLKEMLKQLMQLFSELTITIEEMAFENNVLCFRHTTRGIGGSAPVVGLVMVKFRDGKITDRWAVTEG